MKERGDWGGPRTSWTIGLVLVAGWAATAAADVIVLRGGGEVQGKVIPYPKNAETVQVLLLKGRNPITFKKEQIRQVITSPSPLDEYLVKREKVGPSAQAAFDLGTWCEHQKLTDLARLHYENAIGYDPAFAPAHQKLGHVRHGDRWVTRDELREAQGLIKHRGNWITPEEKTKREDSAHASAAQADWIRRIKALRQALKTDANQARDAEAELMKIEQPEAVGPLLRILGGDEPAIRKLLAHVLGNIPGKDAARGLIELILAEDQNDVRSTLMEHLKERDEPGIVPQLVKALRAEDVRIINRAAWTLGNLGAVSAVPALIGALITSEERIVMVNEGSPANAAAATIPGPALMAMNGSWMAYLTGPVVGPGVVAYGATSVPFMSPAQLMGDGMMAVGINPPNRGPTPRAVTFTYRNTEVRAALNRLTEEDFAFDVAAWKRWMKLSFNPNPNPVRKVPQP